MQFLAKFRSSIHVALFTGVIVSLLALIAMTTLRTTAHTEQDCDDNAVIRCGVTHHGSNQEIINELKAKYRENQAGNVQAVFAAFGMNNEAVFDGMVLGRVTGKNEVYIGDRLVAKNATTAGRQNISNERGSSLNMGGGFWQRPPSVSFADPNGSLNALVKMENNTFKHAVILSCGNPVGASAVALPTPPINPPTPPSPPPSTPLRPTRTFQITKDVRVKGQTAWIQEVASKAGDRLEFRIIVRNTGQGELQQVMVRDVPPTGTTYVEGSLNITGLSSNFFGGGINLGNMAAGQQKEITFEVTVNSTAGSTCTTRSLRNIAFAKATDLMEKQDDATVRVNCVVPVTPAIVTTPVAATPQVLAAGTTPTPAATSSVKTVLPDTGASSIFGIFTLTSFVGGIGHHFLYRRRL